jgi:hypothetical protein
MSMTAVLALWVMAGIIIMFLCFDRADVEFAVGATILVIITVLLWPFSVIAILIDRKRKARQ